MIRISTKKDGFRRAGMAHTGTQDYADDHFTTEQLTALRADPMLVVEDIPDESEKSQKNKKTKEAGD
ncbi:MAG: HI1506-related protein [Desulfovibrionaceae bacterium]